MHIRNMPKLANFVCFMLLLYASGCGSHPQGTTAPPQLPIVRPDTSYGQYVAADRYGIPVVNALRDELHSDDAQVRSFAVQKLGLLWNRCITTIPLLVDLLHDSDAEVREQAAHFLSNCEQRAEAVPALRECLDDADPVVRVRAAESIYRITGDSQTTVPVLARALPALKDSEVSSDPEIRARKTREYGAGNIANWVLLEMGPSARDALNDLIEVWKVKKEGPAGVVFAETIAKIDPERAKELGINIEKFARPARGAPGVGAGGRN